MQSTPSLAVLLTLTDEERQALVTSHSLCRIQDLFAQIVDPRSRHGKRYELPFLLTCLVAGLLCHCNSMDAVGQWCREHQPLLRRTFGSRRHLTPSGSLFRWLLPRLSAEHVEETISAWVLVTRPCPDPEPVALDGKTMRRAAPKAQAKPHLVSCHTHTSRETIAQVQVADKNQEQAGAQHLLRQVPLTDRVVTADALHGHPAFAQAVRDQGGHYLLAIKENEPQTYAALEQYFADPDAVTEEARSRDRQRGRIEQRSIRTSSELNAYLARFPDLAQVACVHRLVQDATSSHEERRYFVTSASPSVADATRLLTLIRGQWTIESGHWIRDEVFGEDRSQLRTGAAPQIMATLRNLVVTLIRRTGSWQITATRRHFAAHPARAFALLRQLPTSR